MLFDPTERNVNPFLFPTRVRTVKKLVLALAIHDKDVSGLHRPDKTDASI